MSGKTSNGGHILMLGIVVDLPAISARYVRSALPDAPVIQQKDLRRTRTRLFARGTLGSRHG